MLEDKIPTGVDFIDRALGGGQNPGQVYGLLGPIGVGKSTLGAMIAAEGALMQTLHTRDVEREGVWVFVTLELNSRSILDMAVSHIAKLDRTVLQRIYFPSDLCQLSRDFSSITDEQLRRIDELLRHLHIIHISNECFRSEAAPVQTIRNRLNDLTSVSGIVIDYAGTAVSQYIELHGLHERNASRLLQEFLADCRSLLARHYSCPVWVIQQLNGTASSRSASALQSHLDASNCRHFGDNLDACFVLGTQDPVSKCFEVHCSKAAQAPQFTLLV